MIKGIGIDIIEIARIDAAINKNPRFITKLFTKEEIAIFQNKGFKPATVAGFFAAKEAVAKAIGTGIRNISWKDIEIYKDEYDKPHIKLHNNAVKAAYSRDIIKIIISISHSRENAVAQAVAI